jgi:hypothetical protein
MYLISSIIDDDDEGPLDVEHRVDEDVDEYFSVDEDVDEDTKE